MEPKIIIYLKRIVKTISIIIVWFIINARWGITNGCAFFENNIKTSNIIFYIWFGISLFGILFWFYKIWNKDIGFDEDNRNP